MHNEKAEHDSVEDSKIDKWYTAEEKSVFAGPDRELENKKVDKFQKTHDEKLFEEVYKERVPTLQIWARKHAYLMDSREDMFGEFGISFTKAVFTYKKAKGHFNTYLFRLLINCTQNLMIGRRAKKRLPEGVEPNAMKKNILSLDYSYDGKDGSGNTLREVVANKMASDENTVEKMIANETANIMSGKDPIVRGFFKRLCDGNTVAALLKEYKTKHGKIRISRRQAQKLSSKRRQKRMVLTILKDNASIDGEFSLLDYSVSNSNKLLYTIEMKKTEEADLVLKTIRKLRKDKKNVLSRISS